MIKIGLTGGFGSGKTAVTSFYREVGIPIIDADEIARLVVEQGSPILKLIQKHFGHEIIQEDGSLNRMQLAEVIFKDQQARQQLNEIIHPAILKQIDQELEGFAQSGQSCAVLDAPLLFETALDKKMDATILVWAPEDVCLKRLVQFRGFTETDARLRIQAQLPIEEKRKKADYIIDNSGSIEKTRKESLSVLEQIRRSFPRSP
jgi:dephospho-CoA kinase